MTRMSAALAAVQSIPQISMADGVRRDAASYDALDRAMHALEARWTLSLSPAALMLASLDWGLHLANAPGRRLWLAEAAASQWVRLTEYVWRRALDHDTRPAIAPEPGDHRFRADAWRVPPFDFLAQGYLLTEEWWRMATTGVRGVSPHHERLVGFVARQLLDMLAPTNCAATNPEVFQAWLEQGGRNLFAGLRRAMLDARREWSGTLRSDPERPDPEGPDPGRPDPERPIVGQDLATTPGDVVMRNDLIELIRYRPETASVLPEPILIVPAWIMKYYILDLNTTDSLVRFLVGRGHQVYVISWRNPGREFADYGMEDYRRLGVMAALEAIATDRPGSKVHACGYCLGGTLLSTAAAAMARDDDDRLASLTLLAAQTDFTEAGELQLFIDESQLCWLEDVMEDQGYLDSRQMAAAFTMLRPVDLIWSKAVSAYLLGHEERTSDLMAWNADATRMPYRMHSEYLRRLFLHNDLAEGRYAIEGRPVALGDIRLPAFLVGTETDHVAPWRSVFKYLLLNEARATFVLTNGGHNAGIVSPPGHPHRHFRLIERPANALYPAPDRIFATPLIDGSWWPTWSNWLAHGSSTPIPAPEPILPSIEPAPGRYVLEG